METRENLNNKIGNINAQIKNIDRVIKNFKNSIDNIRKQISYREEFANLNRAIPLERDTKKKADLEKRKKVVEDLIDDMSFTIPQLQAAQQHIQSLMDPEINKKESLKQELEGHRGERSALPKRWATGKNIRNGAMIGGAAAIAALAMYNYYGSSKENNVKRDKISENIIPAPEKGLDKSIPSDTAYFPGTRKINNTNETLFDYSTEKSKTPSKPKPKNSTIIERESNNTNTYEYLHPMTGEVLFSTKDKNEFLKWAKDHGMDGNDLILKKFTPNK